MNWAQQITLVVRFRTSKHDLMSTSSCVITSIANTKLTHSLLYSQFSAVLLAHYKKTICQKKFCVLPMTNIANISILNQLKLLFLLCLCRFSYIPFWCSCPLSGKHSLSGPFSLPYPRLCLATFILCPPPTHTLNITCSFPNLPP